MSKKSIICLTTLLLIISSQNNMVQAGYMAGDTDEDVKMETVQSMSDMQALIRDENAPLLREQENEEVADVQSQKLAITSSSLNNEDITELMFRRAGLITSTNTTLEESIQDIVLQSGFVSETPLILKNTLADEVAVLMLSKNINFSPASKTLGEKVEQALEQFALTLGKFSPYETLD